MKVTLLNFCFEDYTVELANSLNKFVDLTLVQPESIYSQYLNLIDPAIKVRPFKKFRIRDPRNIFSMRDMVKAIKESQSDVLHVQETNDPWYDLLQFRSGRFPLVTTVHDVFRHPGDGDLIPGSDFTRRVAISRSQQIIVHGLQQEESFTRRFPKLRNRVNVIPHGELGTLYKRCLNGKTLKKEREPYTLLFFGRIWPYKGLDYLLKAMPRVIQNFPEVKLVIAGRGEALDQYSSIFEDSKHFTVLNHFISMEEVTQLFLKCTAVVLPYTEASHSGVASIAFGLGTPIIASDLGGFQETISHSQDGLLVPPRNEEALAQAIIRLLSNRDLQMKLTASALARCQSDLNWDNIAEKTLHVYKKVTAET